MKRKLAPLGVCLILARPRCCRAQPSRQVPAVEPPAHPERWHHQPDRRVPRER